MIVIDLNHWAATYENVVNLADWLVAEKGYDAEELLDFIRKPWHYDTEWEAYKAAQGVGS